MATPTRKWWSAVSEVVPAMLLIAIEPMFLGARAYSQGLLMRAQRTQPFLIFSPIKIGLIVAVGFPLVLLFPNSNGTFLGTALFLGGDLFDAIVYGWIGHRLVREGLLFGPQAKARRGGKPTEEGKAISGEVPATVAD